jgi:hypothetical protein
VSSYAGTPLEIAKAGASPGQGHHHDQYQATNGGQYDCPLPRARDIQGIRKPGEKADEYFEHIHLLLFRRPMKLKSAVGKQL